MILTIYFAINAVITVWTFKRQDARDVITGGLPFDPRASLSMAVGVSLLFGLPLFGVTVHRSLTK